MLSYLWYCIDRSVHANIPSIWTHISMSSDPTNIGSRTKYIVSPLEPLELDLGIARKYERRCTAMKWEVHTSCLIQCLWLDILIHCPGPVSSMEFRAIPFSKTHVEGLVCCFEFWNFFGEFVLSHGEVLYYSWTTYRVFRTAISTVRKNLTARSCVKQSWIPRTFAGKASLFSTNQPHANEHMSTDTDYYESNKISRHVFDSCCLSWGTVIV